MEQMSDINNSSIVSQIFDLRGKFAIIGLTGRTGSGCSTAANILSTEKFDQLALPIPARNGEALTNNERKYQICYDYLQKNWVPAITIKATHIIIWSCLLFDFETFIEKFEKKYDESIDRETDDLKREKLQKGKTVLQEHHHIFCRTYKSISLDAHTHFDTLHKKQYKKECPDQTQIDLIYDFFNMKLPQYYASLKKNIQTVGLSPVEIFQVLGNFIREERGRDNSESSIIELTNLLIKFYRYYYGKYKRQKKTIIVIDTLRNPYEILFLRERYSAFYVMSVNTSEKERRRRLFEKSYTDKQIEDCDRTEYPHKPELRDIYLKQNIERCNEISDIHLVNDFDPNCKNLQNEKQQNDSDDKQLEHNQILSHCYNPQELTRQIMHYMSLILHPGLVQPFPEERTMQIAYTAKYNSGCLSRQVGAVITDERFSIKAIGWNDVPEGQTPCILRNSLHVFCNQADKIAYSNYERYEKEFHQNLQDKILRYLVDPNNPNKTQKEVNERLKGRHVPYCFKDIYNNREKGQNNQVHTRSLHAEENAFLQIAKYGGQGIKGGKLFTTASPCELCSKKAYQLGIKEIYYIDLYPGISKKHILENGWARPEMKMFYGAIGRAYIHLYQPILAYKDEIKELLKPYQLSSK